MHCCGLVPVLQTDLCSAAEAGATARNAVSCVQLNLGWCRDAIRAWEQHDGELYEGQVLRLEFCGKEPEHPQPGKR